jgi:hypothetical protein
MGFLDRLAVVSLWVRKAEQTLFEEVTGSCQSCKTASAAHVLFLVPEREGDVLQAVAIADTSNAVLAPAEGTRASHVMCEVC